MITNFDDVITEDVSTVFCRFCRLWERAELSKPLQKLTAEFGRRLITAAEATRSGIAAFGEDDAVTYAELEFGEVMITGVRFRRRLNRP